MNKIFDSAVPIQRTETNAIRRSIYFTETFLEMEQWRQVEELLSGLIEIYAKSENLNEHDFAKFDGAMRVISDLRSEL